MSENFEMPVPDPALRRLDFLLGTWNLTGSTVEGPMGPSVPITGSETFEWMEGGFFLVHRWQSTFEAGGVSVVDTGYEFLDYEPGTARYRTHFFNSLGPYDHDASKYHGGFEGEALVVTGPARIVRTPGQDGSITVESLVQIGDDEWAPIMTYILTRA
ncbi:DUF1579 family protein [Nonomuraea sp. NPDC050663]|uniref:DUF1579 family protein n=1 Tax=Nonomuraea sp. NPDC050663 TaxID=3364370 RepID=UPI0037AC7368